MRPTTSSTRLSGRRRASLVAAILVALSVTLAACGGDDPPEVAVETPEPAAIAATATATATPRPTRTPTATPEPTETATEAVAAEPTVTSLGALISEYGYPADASFARVRIPVLGVDARVASRYVGGDGVMPNPSGPADIVWYDLSAWSGMGGAPGGGGNAVFSGHVDYNARIGYADVRYRGPGVFRDLGRLSDGDIIEVDYNGGTLRYAVVWVRQLHASADDWAPIWRNSGVDSVTLYTCGGEFDTVARQYSDRVVVRAERI